MTRRPRIALPILLVLCLGLTSTVSPAKDKYETISATAFGTGTQVGRLIRVNFVIYQFSTEQDRQVLVDAFKQGQNQGLAAALQKMKAVGHIDVTGTTASIYVDGETCSPSSTERRTT